MSDMTPEQAQAMLDQIERNPPRVCMAWCGNAKDDCPCYKNTVAVNALNEAAPDLARTYIAQAAAITRLRAKVEAAEKLAEAVEAQWAHDGEPTNADIARVLDALSAYEEAGK
jgi:hypothetical protein